MENQQACVKIDGRFQCFTIENNTEQSNLYRAKGVTSGESVEFTVSVNKVNMIKGKPTSAGGASQPSAEEIAAKLSNPTAPVMTIGSNIDIVAFDGDLDGASDQTSTRYLFQTVFPFKQSNGGVIFFRPAIPVFLMSQVHREMETSPVKALILVILALTYPMEKLRKMACCGVLAWLAPFRHRLMIY